MSEVKLLKWIYQIIGALMFVLCLEDWPGLYWSWHLYHCSVPPATRQSLKYKIENVNAQLIPNGNWIIRDDDWLIEVSMKWAGSVVGKRHCSSCQTDGESREWLWWNPSLKRTEIHETSRIGPTKAANIKKRTIPVTSGEHYVDDWVVSNGRLGHDGWNGCQPERNSRHVSHYRI